VWHPSNGQWWLLVCVALLLVAVWPPGDDRSLAVKVINWAADPRNELPIEPGPLALGLGDDPDAVEEHDSMEQRYYALYEQGGWVRRRLQLKVASDPFNPATERQLLTGMAVVALLVMWRLEGQRGAGR